MTYEVTGDGPVEIVYLEKLGAAPVRVRNAQLPWKFTVAMDTPTLLSVVAVRAGSTAGTISCRALVDGEEVKKNEPGRATSPPPPASTSRWTEPRRCRQ